MVLLGPPGAGKGTQARLLAKNYEIPHISTGEMLRQTVATGSPLGQEAGRSMAQGQLVPDPVILDIVHERLLKSDCLIGYVLDGLPRTLEQALGLGRLLRDLGRSLQAGLSLEVRLESFVQRRAARRVCSRCGMM